MKLSFGVRELGLVIVILALSMSVVLFLFLDGLAGSANDSCTCGDTCTMRRFSIPDYFYFGAGIVALLFIFGAVLALKGKDIIPADGRASWDKNLGKLDPEEREVYRLIIESSGTMFQRDIVDKLGWSKVRVTRTLDSLESRRLLERRRRGLTNIIVLN
ncbi:MAG: MarR family transcriptional regulator [Candidatus Altiarchaeota archaeon]